MKNLKNFKKFSAALTAAAMLGTLSMGVFAAEADEIIEAPVIDSVEIDVPIITVDVEDVEDVDIAEDIDITEDIAEEAELMTVGTGDVVDADVNVTKTSDITITAVTAEKSTADGETLYNVTLSYEMTYQTAAPQITLLGYLFTSAADTNLVESNIRAVDQITHAEKSADTTKSMGEIKFVLSTAQAGVDDNAKLVLMVGTDADLTNAGAQAVAISLASASGEGGSGSGGEEIPPADTWTATGATAAPATFSFEAGVTDEAIKTELADAVTVTVTGEGGKSSTNVNVAWATSDTIADGATATYTGTVTPGTGAPWTGTQTVTVTVTIEEDSEGGGDEPGTVLRGDVNADGKVMPNDGTLLMRVLAGNATLTSAQEKNADVNDDGKVMPNDGTLLMRVLAGNATLD